MSPGLCRSGCDVGLPPCVDACAVCSRQRCGSALGSGGAVSIARGTRVSGVAPRLRLWVRVAAFGAASFALCYDQRGGPDTSAPKAVRGQKRLSTLAEALPLAREIGAGSRAPREIGAGSRGCLSLWRVRSRRDHTPSGIVSADARPAFNGTLRQGASLRDRKPRSSVCICR